MLYSETQVISFEQTYWSLPCTKAGVIITGCGGGLTVQVIVRCGWIYVQVVGRG